ncbi:uncharacterized protein TNCV_3529131 [Trichonephila clavipes]|uniref:Mutator-like transposase domain-containing protein n=1 Tax=Trichonephila clavipes TaxID=2585209 RepID=A0A8X6RFR2_TRICX|nr:uncharacterized protein TNCV_3529131 [Trichonephila clavipes]
MPRQKRSSLVSKQKANKRWCSEHYNHETHVFRKDETSIPSALPERNMRYVTFDGTWLTRGYSSQIGVGCVVDLLTGFVMDFEFMSKRCIECEHAKSDLGENSAEFHVWYEGHISSCAINHVGSSCAMEQEADLKLWQRSEDSGF